MKFSVLLALLFSACAMNPAHEEVYNRWGVHDVIQAHLKEIRMCYERQLKVDPKLAGTVRLSWLIVDEGVTKDVSIDASKSTLHNDQFEQCLTSLLYTLKFPPPPPRQTVDVSYPFLFKN